LFQKFRFFWNSLFCATSVDNPPLFDLGAQISNMFSSAFASNSASLTTTTSSSSSSPNTYFDQSLQFQKLTELEAYLDQYAFYNGFVFKCGRTDTKQITASQFSIHEDNLMSYYPNRHCATSDPSSKVFLKRTSTELSLIDNNANKRRAV